MRQAGSRIPEALKIALNLERKGTDFYLKMARKTKNLLGKRLFNTLAQEEIQHMARIEEIYASIKKDKKWPEFSVKRGGRVEREIKDFFNKLGKKELKKNVDNISGLKMAIELEQKGYEIYSKFAQEAEEENERAFFQALMKEENEHFVALENSYRFLTDADHWYAVEESKVWNWMNI